MQLKGAAARQRLLVRFVRGGKLQTQGDVQRAFSRRGIRVTQSSVSRDIARCGLVKVRGAYVLPDTLESQPLPPLLGVDTAGPNLLVVRTLPGMAPSVAVAIDDRRLPHVVGTVAGDDTVFVATAMGTRQEVVIRGLKRFFPRTTHP